MKPYKKHEEYELVVQSDGSLKTIHDMMRSTETVYDDTVAFMKTVPDNMVYASLEKLGGASIVSGGEIVSADVTELISRSTSTPPVQTIGLVIPDSVAELSGYGLGLGSTYNEVDFTEHVYHNMKEIDLGDLTLSYNDSLKWFACTISDLPTLSSSDITPNILSSRFYPASRNYTANNLALDGIISTTINQILLIRDLTHTNSDLVDGKAPWLKGVIIHYESTNGGSDYNAKIYTQVVASVDLGSLTWSGSDASNHVFRFRPLIEGLAVKKEPNGSIATKDLAEGFTAYPWTPFTSENDMGFGVSNLSEAGSEVAQRVTFVDKSYSTLAAFKAFVSGKKFVYEIAKPRIYDITDILEGFDATINTSSGHKLEFVNMDFEEIPTPSTIKYLVRKEN